MRKRSKVPTGSPPVSVDSILRRTATANVIILDRWIQRALRRGDGDAVVKLIRLRAKWAKAGGDR